MMEVLEPMDKLLILPVVAVEEQQLLDKTLQHILIKAEVTVGLELLQILQELLLKEQAAVVEVLIMDLEVQVLEVRLAVVAELEVPGSKVLTVLMDQQEQLIQEVEVEDLLIIHVDHLQVEPVDQE